MVHQMPSIMEKQKQGKNRTSRITQAHTATKCPSHLEVMRNRWGKKKTHWIEKDKVHSRRENINEAFHWRSLAMNGGELEQ